MLLERGHHWHEQPSTHRTGLPLFSGKEAHPSTLYASLWSRGEEKKRSLSVYINLISASSDGEVKEQIDSASVGGADLQIFISAGSAKLFTGLLLFILQQV